MFRRRSSRCWRQEASSSRRRRSSADRDVVLEVIPGIHDPEDRRMIVIGVIGSNFGLRVARSREDTRHAARVLVTNNGSVRLDAQCSSTVCY